MSRQASRAGLTALARIFLQIALTRRGPQDLPAVGILLPLSIGAYVLLSVALGESFPALRAGWAAEVLADAAFIALWYWLLLGLARRRERYLQTAAALNEIFVPILRQQFPALRAGWAAEVLADAAFIALWYWLLLGLARRRERYLQTAAALFGLQTVLAAPSIACTWLMQRFPHDDIRLTLGVVGSLALLAWTVVVVAHVLRSALERAWLLCLGLAVLQVLAEQLVLIALFSPRS